MPGKHNPLGQHFFAHRRLAAALVAESGIERDDLVYEIGPGRGAFTALLAQRARRVIAVEKDPALADRLQARFGAGGKVLVVCADFRRYPLARIPYKIFGNIPFNATSAIVKKILAAPTPPLEAWLILQEEAAQRFAGIPTTQFALLIRPWFAVQIRRRIGRRTFAPAPQVDAAFVQIRQRHQALVPRQQADLYRRFIQCGFNGPNGDLQRAFKGIFTYNQWKRVSRDLHFDRRAGPGQLTGDQWLALFRCYMELKGRSAKN